MSTPCSTRYDDDDDDDDDNYGMMMMTMNVPKIPKLCTEERRLTCRYEMVAEIYSICDDKAPSNACIKSEKPSWDVALTATVCARLDASNFKNSLRSGTISILFHTVTMGFPANPMLLSSRNTAASCFRHASLLTSVTCSRTSASAISYRRDEGGG